MHSIILRAEDLRSGEAERSGGSYSLDCDDAAESISIRVSWSLKRSDIDSNFQAPPQKKIKDKVILGKPLLGRRLLC